MRENGSNGLPNGWIEAPLGRIADVQLGKMLSQKSKTGSGTRPYLRNINVRWGHVETGDMLQMDFNEREAAKFALREGDVLVCEGGEPGRAAVWRNQLPRALYQKALHRIRSHGDALVPDYLVFHLLHDAQRRRLAPHFTGSTIKHFTRVALCRYEVRVPPLPEQHRIVAEIEKHFTRLDAAVAALERVRANLKRYRAAVLKAACEGRLVTTEAELARTEGRAYEPADQLLAGILKQRRANGANDKRNDGTPLPDGDFSAAIPDGWCVCAVGQIAECLDAKRVPVNKRERAGRLGNVPYYGANGQVGWIDGHIFDEPLVLVVEDETFTGRTQSFSYMIRGRTWVNNHAHVLRATTIPTEFLNCALAHYPFTPRTTGTTGRRKLTQKALMTAPVALPPLAEQHRIVAEVERRLSVIDEIDAVVDANLKRAERLRQAILKRAFEGKLVAQDPNDEPASVLLERIRAERAVAATPSRPSGKRAARGRRMQRTSQPVSRVS